MSNNSAIGGTWNELQKELFTPEEIAASKRRVDNIGGYIMSDMPTIIATIKPIHLGNIRRGVKLYEIRKTCPKKIPFKVL